MNKIKVCLRKGQHTVYDDLLTYPPAGIEFYIPKHVTQSKSKFVDSMKRHVWRLYLKAFKKPHSIKVDTGNSELIHACSGIMIENKVPWVIDVEHAASFVGFEAGRLEGVRNKVDKILSSKYCRKIMPWTEAGKQSLLNGLKPNKTVFDKIEVVYPGFHARHVDKKKSDKLELLFVSYRFFTKGGRELLEAYEIIKKKYDINLTIISDVPNKWKEKYDFVNFVEPNLPRKTIIEDYMSKADIFVLPSYMDTFGVVFLEAMMQSIPSVGSTTFAIPEMIKNSGITVNVEKYSWYGKDYLFAWDSWEKFSKFVEETPKPDVVKELMGNISDLIDDTSLRKQLGEHGRKEIESGKFSIETRNKKLKEIYVNALRD